MKSFFLPFAMITLLTISCSGRQESNVSTNSEIDTLAIALEGDSTVYGLACDGCNDTIVVFLPIKDIAADPDTFNVLNATRCHHVFGRLRAGDKIAVVRNPEDSTVADYVIDMENLRGTWCYEVMPTLHIRADMAGRTENQILSSLPDSVRELLSIPRQYTMQIKGDHTVMSFGSHFLQNEEEEPLVDYPLMRRYGHWNLHNGKLLLTEVGRDSVGNAYALSTDTANFILLSRDTLVLSFKDGVRNYHPKRD